MFSKLAVSLLPLAALAAGAVAFTVAAAPSAAQTDLCGAPPNPYGYTLCTGAGETVITDPPSDFCSYFPCIGSAPSYTSFWNGVGYVVECGDGDYSKSGGRSEVCSDHEGYQATLYQVSASSAGTPTPTGTATSTGTPTATSTPVSTLTFSLLQGWNLIGWAGPTMPVVQAIRGGPHGPAGGTTGPPGKPTDVTAYVSVVWGYDSTTQAWHAYFPSSGAVPGANDLTDLTHLGGYFVYATEAVQWVIGTS